MINGIFITVSILTALLIGIIGTFLFVPMVL